MRHYIERLSASLAPNLSYLIVATIIGSVFIGPGFFLHRWATPSHFASRDDYHYGVVYGSALRIALGHPIAGLRINFGLLSTVTAAALAKMAAVSTFAGWIKITQCFQLSFFILAAASVYAMERSLRFTLFVLFPTSIYAATWTWFVSTPNNTGFRFIGFAILPLALSSLRTLFGLRASVVAGLWCAFFILWNIETGLACVSALVCYIVLAESAGGSNMLRATGFAFCTVVIALLASYSAAIVMLGTKSEVHLLLVQLRDVAGGGYNGHLFDNYSVLAAALALYASSLLIYGCLSVRDRTADRSLLSRCALATAAIVWLGYYAHNSFDFDLSIILFLLLCTLKPFVLRSPKTYNLSIAAALFFNALLFPPRPTFRTGPTDIQGVEIIGDEYLYLNERDSTLTSISTSDIAYFVSMPFLTAVQTRRLNDWPIFDAFSEIWTERDFADFTKNLTARHPSLILIESDNSPFLDNPRRHFLARLRAAIAKEYKYFQTEGGLEFWKPVIVGKKYPIDAPDRGQIGSQIAREITLVRQW
jgi:hypothetical protein